MDRDDIARVTASFERVEPELEELTRRFYATLFRRHPALRSLFPKRLASQRQKLGAALTMAVRTLRKPDTLVPLLENLGRSHAHYGVRDEHFAPVGGALVFALSRVDDGWDDDVQRSWITVYGVIARAMGRGLARAERAAE